MHAYATDATDRKVVPTVLAVVSVGLAFALSKTLSLLGYQPPWYVDTPSVMGFYGLLYVWFDKIGWRCRIKSAQLSRIPDLRGTWRATLKSSYKDAAGQPTVVEGVVHIRQTWTRLSIRIQFGSSTSCSTMGAINTEDSPDAGVNYEYLNEPEPHGVDTMSIHRGTSHLRISIDGRTLVGDYYTGRGRMNFGSLALNFISRDLE